MVPSTLALLEMGSNSLKMHVVHGDGRIETRKDKCDIAHEFYGVGTLSELGADRVARSAARLAADVRAEHRPDRILAIATGVFREIPQVDAIMARVGLATGTRPSVISGADEASLLASAARHLGVEGPALLCDLGGSSLECVGLDTGRELHQVSLPLGAIRNTYLFGGERPTRQRAWASFRHCDELLQVLPSGLPVVVTGGTARAVSALTGSAHIEVPFMEALVEQTLVEGPPPALPPARARVFLAGLTILARLGLRAGTGSVQHRAVGLEHALARRLQRLLRHHVPDEIESGQLLLRTHC